MVAALDRRIEIAGGTDEERDTLRRVSDLRDRPFVVLLGEPGIGKSTVLAAEAARERTQPKSVRELIHRQFPARRDVLFIDALDEYRSDGSPADKAMSLASAIVEGGARRWWLSSTMRSSC